MSIKLKQAAQQSLDALVKSKNALEVLWVSHHANRTDYAIEDIDSAIEALRTAIQQALQAEVTDAQIESEFQRCGGKWDGNQWVIEDADLHPFARTILALRPVQVPMTMKQIEDMALQEQFLLICDGLDELTIIVEAIEAHHGITVKVKNEAL